MRVARGGWAPHGCEARHCSVWRRPWAQRAAVRHARVCARAHMHTCAHMHACAGVYTHTCTDACVRARTHPWRRAAPPDGPRVAHRHMCVRAHTRRTRHCWRPHYSCPCMSDCALSLAHRPPLHHSVQYAAALGRLQPLAYDTWRILRRRATPLLLQSYNRPTYGKRHITISEGATIAGICAGHEIGPARTWHGIYAARRICDFVGMGMSSGAPILDTRVTSPRLARRAALPREGYVPCEHRLWPSQLYRRRPHRGLPRGRRW